MSELQEKANPVIIGAIDNAFRKTPNRAILPMPNTGFRKKAKRVTGDDADNGFRKFPEPVISFDEHTAFRSFLKPVAGSPLGNAIRKKAKPPPWLADFLARSNAVQKFLNGAISSLLDNAFRKIAKLLRGLDGNTAFRKTPKCVTRAPLRKRATEISERRYRRLPSEAATEISETRYSDRRQHRASRGARNALLEGFATTQNGKFRSHFAGDRS